MPKYRTGVSNSQWADEMPQIVEIDNPKGRLARLRERAVRNARDAENGRTLKAGQVVSVDGDEDDFTVDIVTVDLTVDAGLRKEWTCGKCHGEGCSSCNEGFEQGEARHVVVFGEGARKYPVLVHTEYFELQEDEEDLDGSEDEEGEPEEDDVTTEDDVHFYQSGKLWLTLDRDLDDRAMWRALHAQMKKDNYYPNVWRISDHGNSALLRPPKGMHLSGLGGPAEATYTISVWDTDKPNTGPLYEFGPVKEDRLKAEIIRAAAKYASESAARQARLEVSVFNEVTGSRVSMMVPEAKLGGLGGLGDVSKKDFVAIAKLLKDNGVPAKLVTEFARYFKSQNPRFDTARFEKAAGLGGR